jgi:beta-lactam-binding protein with PASTA domain
MTTSFHPGTRRVKHAHALVVGLWGALFLALLLVPVALGQTRPQQRTRAGAQVRTVQVPNVTGRSVEEARTILAHGGLRLGTVSEGEARGAPKTVYGQKPPAGTVVALGTPVSVWVVAGRKPPAGAGTDQPAGSTTSSYPQATRVPPLIGSNVPQASQILERYRLVLGNVNKVNSNQARAGIIIRQDPPANRTVRVGSSVNVWVAVAKQQPAEPGNTYSPSG